MDGTELGISEGEILGLKLTDGALEGPVDGSRDGTEDGILDSSSVG